MEFHDSTLLKSRLLAELRKDRSAGGKPVVFVFGSATSVPAESGQPGVPGVGEMLGLITDQVE